MRALGNRSMASKLKRFLDFLYWCVWLAVFAVLVTAVAMPFIPSAVTQAQIEPVHFELTGPAMELTSTEGAKARLTSSVGKLSLPRQSLGNADFSTLFAVGSVAVLTTLALALLGLRELRGLLDTFVRNQPFDGGNRRRLRRIALIIALFEATRAATSFAIGWAVRDLFTSDTVQLVTRWNVDAAPLVAAAVIWILAEIFALGTALETEQELVV